MKAKTKAPSNGLKQPRKKIDNKINLADLQNLSGVFLAAKKYHVDDDKKLASILVIKQIIFSKLQALIKPDK